MIQSTIFRYVTLTVLTGIGMTWPLALSAVDDNDSDPIVSITVSEVANERLSPAIPTAGTVFSRHTAQITAGLDAQLQWVAEPGDYIEMGDTVAKFDCTMIELRREEQLAQVQLEQIRYDSLGRELQRLQQATLATSVIQLERVKADRDQAGGAIRVAQVRVRQTENELKRCTAPAPFAGIVTSQLRRDGEDVNRGDLLATMTDTQHLEVRAAVPIRYLPRIQAGNIATVRLNEIRFEGVVRTAVPAATAASQTFEVRIDLPASAPEHVASGQLVSATLPLNALPSLTVPRDSIVLRSDGAFVMRIDADNIAKSVAVEVADASGERVAVRGQLSAGDRVAVRGAEALVEGELVAVFAGG